MGFTAIEGSLWKPASGVRVTTCPGAGGSFIGTGPADGAVGSCALALTAKKRTAALYRVTRRRFAMSVKASAGSVPCREIVIGSRLENPGIGSVLGGTTPTTPQRSPDRMSSSDIGVADPPLVTTTAVIAISPAAHERIIENVSFARTTDSGLHSSTTTTVDEWRTATRLTVLG